MAGTIDAWAEAFSVGVRRPGDLMLMYGSTMFMVGVTPAPIRHPKLWATAAVEPGLSCVAAGMATSGSVVEWLRELAGGIPVQDLVAEAAATAPGADGLLLLPYLAGERSPLFDPDARGVLAGLTLSHERRHLARAAYEATAFGVRHNLEAIGAGGWQAERVVAVGGGASSAFWPQIVSDVAGVRQVLPARTIGAAYGDALMAAIGSGLVAADTDWTAEAGATVPRAEVRSLYDDRYALYRRLYDDTVDVVHRLAAS
jgi:xylulokinase